MQQLPELSSLGGSSRQPRALPSSRSAALCPPAACARSWLCATWCNVRGGDKTTPVTLSTAGRGNSGIMRCTGGVVVEVEVDVCIHLCMGCLDSTRQTVNSPSIPTA